MALQIAIGSGLILLSVLTAGIALWALQAVLWWPRAWLARAPHRPKMMLVLCVAMLWILGAVTAGVWIWAATFRALGIFETMEGAVYFALVAFTTLGFGDVLLPTEWRLLGGMAAANGLVNFGLVTAMLIEVLRDLRIAQREWLLQEGRSDAARGPGAAPARR